jgi:hypothetical protein
MCVKLPDGEIIVVGPVDGGVTTTDRFPVGPMITEGPEPKTTPGWARKINRRNAANASTALSDRSIAVSDMTGLLQ